MTKMGVTRINDVQVDRGEWQRINKATLQNTPKWGRSIPDSSLISPTWV
jgi:hypothetical protein